MTLTPEGQKNLLAYINGSLAMQGILYDFGLMPEQLQPESNEWHFMLGMAAMHKLNVEVLSVSGPTNQTAGGGEG